MNLVYLIWLLLGFLGVLALGFGAVGMALRQHEALAPWIAVGFGTLALQHMVFVYLAARPLLGISGPSGALLLTITQALVTPAMCALAARLLGWIGTYHRKGGHDAS